MTSVSAGHILLTPKAWLNNIKIMFRMIPQSYIILSSHHHHHPVPCFIALAIMSFHIPRSLVAFRISTTLPAPSQLASPSAIFSRCFPLLRFPFIIPVVMRFLTFPFSLHDQRMLFVVSEFCLQVL